MPMVPWEPKVIKRVMKVLPSSTGAARVHTDAGEAYAKALGNPSGSHALACELVGTKLAARLGLPTFEVALVNYPGKPVIEYGDRSTARAGTAFLARFVRGTPWGEDPNGLKLVSNPEMIAGLVVFDTWTRNKDRHYPYPQRVRKNLNNVFLTEEDAPAKHFRLLAIDHTECFREHSGDLQRNLGHIDRVKDVAVHGLFDEFVPYVTREAVAPFIERLAALPRADVQEIVNSVPPDWDVGQEMRRVLIDFICDRARFLSDRLPAILAGACTWQQELFN